MTLRWFRRKESPRPDGAETLKAEAQKETEVVTTPQSLASGSAQPKGAGMIEAYCGCGSHLGSFSSAEEYTAWRDSHAECGGCGSSLDRSLITKWPQIEIQEIRDGNISRAESSESAE